ncbi:exonuclease domain-containing protein [Micrococcus endophyticus]|uniref:exonuclease domain-containing protein n=1 Tax=Micrococcus endophyticus TaxID=455343 RepID=UPI0034CE6F7B
MAVAPDLDFIAVDMETANPQRASVCAVGIAVVRSGEVVAAERWLVTPPTGADDFSPVNVGLHGIDAAAVAGAPTWDEVADALDGLGESLPLVAYNAPFDRGVYEAACAATGRRPADLRWLDALALVRRHLPHLDRATLAHAARDLGVPLRNHHDAAEDATATAEIVLALAHRAGAGTLDELWARPAEGAASPGPEWFSDAGKARAADIPRADPDAPPTHPLHGRHVVITGSVLGRTRMSLWHDIAAAGGQPQKNVTKKTDLVVAADHDDVEALPSGNPSARQPLTGKLAKAMEYAAAGQTIRYITAAALVEMLSTGGEPAPRRAADAPSAARPVASAPDPAGSYVPASLSQSRFPEPPRPAPERREPAAAPAPSSSRAAVAQPARPSTARRLLGVLLVGVALFLGVFFVAGAVVVAEDLTTDPGQAAVGTSITLVAGLLAYLAGRTGMRRLRG